MKMAIILPAGMVAGVSIIYLLSLAAKYLPDWAYFGLFLVVVPAIIGMFIDYKTKSKSQKPKMYEIKLNKGKTNG